MFENQPNPPDFCAANASDWHLQALERLTVERQAFVNFTGSLTGDNELSGDIVQQVQLKILERKLHPRNPAALRPWIYRLLRNAVIDHYRRKGTELRATEAFWRERQPKAEGEPCVCAQRRLDQMKPEYSDALREMEMRGLSVKKYAEQRNISTSNASVRLHRARKALRRRVEQTCGACAGAGCFACSCQR